MKNRTLATLALALCTSALGTSVLLAQTTAAPADALPDAPTPAPTALPEPLPTGPTVVFDTTMGRIVCKLFTTEAPITSQNFIDLAEGKKEWTDPITHRKMLHKRFYDGTIFHRVIPNFMAQGGDPSGTGMGDAGFYFNQEPTPTLLFNKPGRLAMANAGPNTNSSQFFITEVAVPQLDGGYNLFGQCDDAGVAVVTAIDNTPRDSSDKPLTPVVLNKVTIVRDGQPMPPLPAAAAPAATAPAAMPRPLPRTAPAH